MKKEQEIKMENKVESNYLKQTHISESYSSFSKLGFASLILMAFLLNYVESMVIPSIPALQVTFNSTTSISSWIVSAFLISGTVAAPLFGKLGDSYGKKRMLLVTFVIYSLGVGMAGFSPSIQFLILSRALQGIGFGGIPLGFALLIDMFPREKVSGAQGIMSGLFATGGVTGLVAGSYIISIAGWQWAFHSALILSVMLLGALFLFVRDHGKRVKERIDFGGAFTLTLGLTLFLLYITEGSMHGWLTLDNLIMLAFGVGMIIVFLSHERKSMVPLLQLKLFSDRNILVANVIGIFAGIIMQLMFLSLVYYANDPRPFGDGFSNIKTGLVIAPGAIAMAGFGPFIGRLIARIGPKPILVLGSGLLGLGMLTFIFLRGDIYWLIVSGIFTWMGIVSMIVPSVNMIALGLPPERRSIGMGTSMMLRNMGGAIGPAIAASFMTVYSTAITLPQNGSIIYLPEPSAFNYIMVIGLLLISAVFLVNLGTKNYHFRNETGQ